MRLGGRVYTGGMNRVRKKIVLEEMYGRMMERFGPQEWWPGETAFEVMVGAVLTQNTAWMNVEKAIERLKAQGVLEAGKLHGLGAKGIAPLIRPAGYFNLKAQRLWNLLDWFVGKYGASFERLEGVATAALREELLGVTGVGPETADAILLYALGRDVFVVDAYTRRIFSRHGLAKDDATYEELKALAEGHIERDRQMYNEYHALLVMVGKHFCKPVPRCAECPLRVMLPKGSPLLKAGEDAGRMTNDAMTNDQ